METLKSVIGLFKFNNSLFESKVFSLSEEEANKRIGDTVNPPIWVAGHLTSSRNHVLNLVGVERQFPWEKEFKEKYDTSTKYPTIKQLGDEFNDISSQLFTQLENIEDAQLDKDLGYELPHGAKTIRGGLVFWLYHEAWHVGQVAIMRRSQEMDGVVPY